jgi:hypothetical protein
MNSVKHFLLAAFLVFSAGCATQTRDVDQARSYRLGLASHLGISQEQIRVEPSRGVTNVTFFGIQSDADRQRIATDLTTLNRNNPKMNPLKWSFQ